jgi:four helix bundle protein
MSGVGYRDLLVWQKAIRLVAACYELCKSLPRNEEFGLTSQMRRAAVSVAANIAEGHGRHHPRDFARFLSMARGSVTEVETYLVIVVTLKFASEEELAVALELCNEISRMISGLSRSIRERA